MTYVNIVQAKTQLNKKVLILSTKNKMVPNYMDSKKNTLSHVYVSS